jgi:YebC/PmpR family DNA-binding regulatory protein
MSGHSRWSTIKRKKGAADARKGKVFTKLIKEITIAARGGGDPNTNSRLRSAITSARQQNMPGDNIERAIKKGTGELEGVSYEEITYEGYGPGGAAVIVDVVTDNKQRTLSEVRHAFTAHNGNLGENGCVAWNFETKGLLVVAKGKMTEDQLMELALEAGADDVREEGENFEVITDPREFENVKKKFEEGKIAFVEAEIAKLPKNMMRLEGKAAENMVKLVAELEDNDDVQHVYTNSDIPDEIMESIGG